MEGWGSVLSCDFSNRGGEGLLSDEGEVAGEDLLTQTGDFRRDIGSVLFSGGFSSFSVDKQKW